MSDVAVIANTAVAIIAVVVMIVRFKFNPVVSLVVGSAYLGLATGLGIDKTIEAITDRLRRHHGRSWPADRLRRPDGRHPARDGRDPTPGPGTLLRRLRPEADAIRDVADHRDAACSRSSLTCCWSSRRRSRAPWPRRSARTAPHGWPPRWPSASSAASCSRSPASAPSPWPACWACRWARCCSSASLLVIPTVAISVAIMSFLFNHGWWNPERDEQHFLGADRSDRTKTTKTSAHRRHRCRRDSASGPVAASPPRPHRCRPRQDAADRAARARCSSRCCSSRPAPSWTSPTSTPRSCTFISEPVIALLIGLIGTSLVGRYAFGAKRVERAIATGFKESGQILILTGVGGSLAATIEATGLGDILGEYFTATHAAPLLMVWADRRGPAHRRRFGDDLRHHLGRHPRPGRTRSSASTRCCSPSPPAPARCSPSTSPATPSGCCSPCWARPPAAR